MIAYLLGIHLIFFSKFCVMIFLQIEHLKKSYHIEYYYTVYMCIFVTYHIILYIYHSFREKNSLNTITSLCGPMLPKEQTVISQVIQAYHFIYIWYFDRKSIWNWTLKKKTLNYVLYTLHCHPYLNKVEASSGESGFTTSESNNFSNFFAKSLLLNCSTCLFIQRCSLIYSFSERMWM